MVLTSLKALPEVFHSPTIWWPAELKWSNYPDALDVFPFGEYAINTLQITVPVAVGTTVSSSLVAYGFSRLRWRGRDIVFYLVLATLMIPSWVTLVPLYILFNRLGWVNTYRPLIVPASSATLSSSCSAVLPSAAEDLAMRPRHGARLSASSPRSSWRYAARADGGGAVCLPYTGPTSSIP